MSEEYVDPSAVELEVLESVTNSSENSREDVVPVLYEKNDPLVIRQENYL